MCCCLLEGNIWSPSIFQSWPCCFFLEYSFLAYLVKNGPLRAWLLWCPCFETRFHLGFISVGCIKDVPPASVTHLRHQMPLRSHLRVEAPCSEDSVHCNVVGMMRGWSMDSGACGANLEAEILAEVEPAGGLQALRSATDSDKSTFQKVPQPPLNSATSRRPSVEKQVTMG